MEDIIKYERLIQNANQILDQLQKRSSKQQLSKETENEALVSNKPIEDIEDKLESYRSRKNAVEKHPIDETANVLPKKSTSVISFASSITSSKEQKKKLDEKKLTKEVSKDSLRRELKLTQEIIDRGLQTAKELKEKLEPKKKVPEKLTGRKNVASKKVQVNLGKQLPSNVSPAESRSSLLKERRNTPKAKEEKTCRDFGTSMNDLEKHNSAFYVKRYKPKSKPSFQFQKLPDVEIKQELCFQKMPSVHVSPSKELKDFSNVVVEHVEHNLPPNRTFDLCLKCESHRLKTQEDRNLNDLLARCSFNVFDSRIDRYVEKELGKVTTPRNEKVSNEQDLQHRVDEITEKLKQEKNILESRQEKFGLAMDHLLTSINFLDKDYISRGKRQKVVPSEVENKPAGSHKSNSVKSQSSVKDLVWKKNMEFIETVISNEKSELKNLIPSPPANPVLTERTDPVFKIRVVSSSSSEHSPEREFKSWSEESLKSSREDEYESDFEASSGSGTAKPIIPPAAPEDLIVPQISLTGNGIATEKPQTDPTEDLPLYTSPKSTNASVDEFDSKTGELFEKVEEYSSIKNKDFPNFVYKVIDGVFEKPTRNNRLNHKMVLPENDNLVLIHHSSPSSSLNASQIAAKVSENVKELLLEASTEIIKSVRENIGSEIRNSTVEENVRQQATMPNIDLEKKSIESSRSPKKINDNVTSGSETDIVSTLIEALKNLKEKKSDLNVKLPETARNLPKLIIPDCEILDRAKLPTINIQCKINSQRQATNDLDNENFVSSDIEKLEILGSQDLTDSPRSSSSGEVAVASTRKVRSNSIYSVHSLGEVVTCQFDSDDDSVISSR